MLYQLAQGFVIVVLLLGVTSTAAQDQETKGLLEFVEQGLKENTLIPAVEAGVAEEAGAATAEAATVVKRLSGLIARVYRAGAYKTGAALAKRTLSYAETKLGLEHPDTLTSVNNLAFLYGQQGRYGDAEPLYQRALAARERVLGPEHPDTLTSVNNLAGLYDSQGRYGDAEPLYQRALAASERVLGPEHPDTLSVLMNTIVLLINMENTEAAFATLQQLEPRLFTYAAIQLQTTAKQRVRRQFLLTQSTFQDVVFTLATQHPSTALTRYAAGVLLRWKRLQGDEDAYLARLVRTSDSPSLQEVGQDIITLRSALSHLLNAPEPDADQLRHTLQTLEARELQLSQHSRRYKQHLASRGVRSDDVRAHLPTRSALLEFKLYNPVNFHTGALGKAHLAALFLSREPFDNQALQLVDLGPVSDLAALWTDLRQGFTVPKAQALYHKLFSPFEPYLQQLDTLYLAPDGFLHLVALSRLVLPDGQYWFQRQHMRQIHTGRNLIPRPRLTQPQGFVAFGGMDYNHHGASAPPTTPLPQAPTTAAGETRALRRYLAEHIAAFTPLKHSGAEAAEIAESFWDYAGSTPLVFQGPDASEARLKALQTPPRVLHLATHGFYLPRAGVASERPMALAGLALAGANRGMTGALSPSGEDGILYALEAQNLNLEGTELLALSACDTAKGVVDYADGVYGLTRAFRIAGVRNVLMTLWPVGDASARAFMQHFYRAWFGQGMQDAALALEKTRQAFLQHRTVAWRASQVWAPFVLVESH